MWIRSENCRWSLLLFVLRKRLEDCSGRLIVFAFSRISPWLLSLQNGLTTPHSWDSMCRKHRSRKRMTESSDRSRQPTPNPTHKPLVSRLERRMLRPLLVVGWDGRGKHPGYTSEWGLHRVKSRFHPCHHIWTFIQDISSLITGPRDHVICELMIVWQARQNLIKLIFV